MRVTPALLRTIEDEMLRRGIKKGELAEALGLGASWATMFFKGELQTLRPEHRRVIERLLGLDLSSHNEEQATRVFGPEAHQVADLVERSGQAAELGRLMLKIFHQPETVSVPAALPPFTPKELESIGVRVRRLADDFGEMSAREIGKRLVSMIDDAIVLAQDFRPRKSLTARANSLFLEHRGGVSAGKPPAPMMARYWPVPHLCPRDHYILRVFGNAMMPAIPDGFDVIVKPYRGELASPGDIFVAKTPMGRRLVQIVVSEAGPDEDVDAGDYVESFRLFHSEHAQHYNLPENDSELTDIEKLEGVIVSVIEEEIAAVPTPSA